MADYTGNYQNIAGRPSFFMSWSHYLWDNGLKYDGKIYPRFFSSSNLSPYNVPYQLLDFNNVQRTLIPLDSSETASVNYELCDFDQWGKFKIDMENLLFDHIFILNHNFKSAGVNLTFKDISNYDITTTDIINGSGEFDGFSLLKIDNINIKSSYIKLNFDPAGSTFQDNIKIGSIIFAKKFTMPVTPHVNHSLTFMPNSVSGSTSIANVKHYNSANVYGNSNVFRVHNGADYKGLIKSGKRRYNIAFDMLLNSVTSPSLFPVNEAGNVEPSTDGFMNNTDDIYSDYEDGIPYEEEGLTWKSNSFVGRVWTLTNGFNQPLIFLPNNDYEAYPDQYSICRIKGDTFKADQVANGAYKMRLELEEQS